MSTATLPEARSAATRRMIREARALTPPPGWGLRWRVEMLGSLTDPDLALGWSDFDAFEDAVSNFRALRSGRVPARIVAHLVSPTAG